jgi:hypothetical protein
MPSNRAFLNTSDRAFEVLSEDDCEVMKSLITNIAPNAAMLPDDILG